MDLLSGPNAGRRRLRELLAADDLVVAPGAFDAFSARLVELAGFDAVYMTGFGTAASRLGRPDIGLLGMSEMAGQAASIVAATSIPVIADADTGYGNPLNVIHTVRTYEAAGVAAFHLEDQVHPKRCGHMDGKEVVPTAEMVAKVEAAVAARTDPDLTIIARTDARAPEGFDAALDRMRAYIGAGADVAFVEAPQSLDEIERIAAELSPTPLLFNWVEKAKSPPVSIDQLRELGFALVILPITTLLAATRAMTDTLATVARHGTSEPVLDELASFDEFTDLIGLGETRELARRFGTEPGG
ncbi:MAG: oxaloacetate decarboxylase [Actinomycetota bacterium]|nr:oxaloacetate decarboxylase [Actinomycetota bacterium]